jgi:tetratricopeptide (TPR) repeat protein
VDEAIACYRKVIALDPKFAPAHTSLGAALFAIGKVDEALAAFRECIRHHPRSAYAHDWIAYILVNKGDAAGARPFAEKAVALGPKVAQAHWNLGRARMGVGDLQGATAAHKKALALDPKHGGARNDLARTERLVAARDKVAAMHHGSYTPASNPERLSMAEWCQIKKCHHTATGLYAAAFAAEPKLADDLKAGHRYRAARHAALAAAGQGEDASKLDDKEKTRLRQQALDWLRADLALHTRQQQTGKPADRAAVQQALRRWQKDTDLAGIRDKDALAKLPAEERAACAKLWSDVVTLLKKAETTGKKETKP